MTLSLTLMAFTNPDGIVTAMTDAAADSLGVCVSLMAVYCVWMGLINIVKDCKLAESLSKKAKPVIKKLFGDVSDDAMGDLSLNLSSNLLGVGGASTPTALSALKKMDKGDGRPTKGMLMLFVINSCGLSVIPATVIGMRAGAGSAAPADIILPCLLAGVITTALGVLLVSLLVKDK